MSSLRVNMVFLCASLGLSALASGDTTPIRRDLRVDNRPDASQRHQAAVTSPAVSVETRTASRRHHAAENPGANVAVAGASFMRAPGVQGLPGTTQQDAQRGACGAVDITQSTDPATVLPPALSVACYDDGNNCTTENELARSFDLSAGATAG